MVAGILKREGLGFGQGGLRAGIEATGIFALRPKDMAEEFIRNFVVLGVGRVGMGGDRIGVHVAREAVFPARRRPGQLPPGLAAKEIDSRQGQAVGQGGAFGQRRSEVHDDFSGLALRGRGGAGKKAEVAAI